MTYANMASVPTQTAGTSPVIAADWNTYVRDNFADLKFGHIVCTSSTRPSTSLAEGVMIYETDTNKVLVYNGSTWIEVNDLDYSPGYTVCTSSTRPSSNLFEGQMIYETDTNLIYVYDGSAWKWQNGTENKTLYCYWDRLVLDTESNGTYYALDPVTPVQGASTVYHSNSIASSTLTITHKLAGSYQITGWLYHYHAAVYSQTDIMITIGGTSTINGLSNAPPVNSQWSVWGDDVNDGNMLGGFNFTLTATANQTSTYKVEARRTSANTGAHYYVAGLTSTYISS